jgi:hypothetical protein
MPVQTIGQIYTPNNAGELRDQFLRDVRLEAISAGLTAPPVTPNTDWYILGTAVANLCLIGLANTAIGLDAQSILDAEGDDLEKIRKAYGVPEVGPSPATGAVRLTVTGSVTLPAGSQFLYPNGLRGQTTATLINPTDGDEVPVIAIDSGKQTNLAGGNIVRFVTPPVGIATEATVSVGSPITGGTDGEPIGDPIGDTRKRERILETLRNKPAGGNWAHIREIAKDALGSVEDCYVYPALGGPGSVKVVPVKPFDLDNNDFSRAMSTAALDVVQAAIQAQLPTPQQVVIQAAADQAVDVALQVSIPASALAGGNGRGWVDPAPWPPLVAADAGRVLITTTVTDGATIVVGANSSTGPVNGQTHIAWWSSADRKFLTALVVSASGVAGTWSLSLDRALVGKNAALPQVGDFICPAAFNLDRYGAEWVAIVGAMGPGENTVSYDPRLPRALRHPFITDEDPIDLNAVALTDLAQKFAEMTNVAYSYTSQTSPVVPSTVDLPPNILVPHNFGVYPL